MKSYQQSFIKSFIKSHIGSNVNQINYLFGNLLQESFEAVGYDNLWSQVVGTNTNVEADPDNSDTTVTGGGLKVLKLVSAITPTATATASRAYAYIDFTAQQIVYCDALVKIGSSGLTNGQGATLVWLTENGNSNIAIALQAYNNGGTLVFQSRVYNNGAESYTLGTSIILDTWYHLKMKYDITNNSYSISINNVEISSGVLSGTLRANIGRIWLGINATRQLTSYYDLVNLDSSQFSNY